MQDHQAASGQLNPSCLALADNHTIDTSSETSINHPVTLDIKFSTLERNCSKNLKAAPVPCHMQKAGVEDISSLPGLCASKIFIKLTSA